MRSRRSVRGPTAMPPRPAESRRWWMLSRLDRRALTTSTRLCWAARAPIALTMVWVPPVPGRVFTTSELPAAMFAITCSCSASASRRRLSVAGGRSSCGMIDATFCDCCSARLAAGFPATASRTGCSSIRASRSMSPATSAKLETTRRGCTANHGRCEVRPRSWSMTGCGLKTPFCTASSTNCSGSIVMPNCCLRARASCGLK
ncbi:hypothetical protein C5C27_09755 [Rathayibacter sp. AY2B7]|nr:hypothetical protein C5C27_09755 [Rathayibacter sp. AY2B7]